MTYQAKVAYPYAAESERALAALRGHLRAAATADGAVPEWSTLHVTGPTQVIGARGIFWYEWTATVESQQFAGHYL